MSYSSVVPAHVEQVFAWYGRQGCLERLLPPWLPVRVGEEPASLRDGRLALALPGGLVLSGVFRPEAFDPPHCFASRGRAWQHTHVLSEVGAGTRVEDRVVAPMSAERLRPLFAYQHRQLAGDLAAHALATSLRPGPLHVAVTGSRGLVGSALSALLTSLGNRVTRLVRRLPETPQERQWLPGEPAPEALEDVDAVVHLAGAPIAGRFSEQHKRAVRDSRVHPTRLLAEAAARAGGPRAFISASAIGYYGPQPVGVVTEASPQGDGFLAAVVADWEAATEPAWAAGLRVVQVRTGVVQSPRGGMLGALYPVFLAGLGGRLGDGSQWCSWVAIDDLVDVYLRALVDEVLSGPVNAVSPLPVTGSTYTAALARALGRPSALTVPRWAVRAVIGREGGREFAEASQRVRPAVLEAAGHRFRYPELEPALRHVLGRWPGPPSVGLSLSRNKAN